jgi:hypothetical protein
MCSDPALSANSADCQLFETLESTVPSPQLFDVNLVAAVGVKDQYYV